MRTDGTPSPSAVASAKAFGSSMPASSASVSHAPNWAIGSGSSVDGSIGIGQALEHDGQRASQALVLGPVVVERGADADEASPAPTGRARRPGGDHRLDGVLIEEG